MSQPLNNIDRFNLTTLKLFDILYDAFPNPIDIESKEIGIAASPDDADFTESFKFAIFADSAVSWLVEEGFIRCDPMKFGTRYRNARLTMKGLTVLGYMPTSVTQSAKPESLSTKIKKTLAAGAEKAGTEAVKLLLTEVFKLATSPTFTHTLTGMQV